MLYRHSSLHPIFIRSDISEPESVEEEEEIEEATEMDSESPKHTSNKKQRPQSQHQVGLKEVVALLSRPHFIDMISPFLEDVLRHLSVSQTQHLEHSSNYSLYARLKRVLKSKLKNPLFLGVTLVLSVHSANMQVCLLVTVKMKITCKMWI